MAKYPFYSEAGLPSTLPYNTASSASGLPDHITIGELLALNSCNVRDEQRTTAQPVGGGRGSYHDWSTLQQTRLALPNLGSAVGTAWGDNAIQPTQAAKSASEATEEGSGKQQHDKKENK